MINLSYRQEKIQAKRKQTPWRDFVMEIASHFPVNLYRNGSFISKYPNTDRVGKLVLAKDRNNYSIISKDYSGDVLDDMKRLLTNSHLDSINYYGSNENCDYSEAVYGAKNGYLSFSIGDTAENIFYSCFVRTNVTNIFDSFYIEKNSSNIYRSFFVQSSFNVFFSKYITDSRDIWLSTNLIGCTECILCDNLQNQSYCIKNQPFSKEEYFVKKKELLKNNKLQFEGLYLTLHRAINKEVENCSGEGLYKCSHIENGYLVRNMTDSRNIICGTGGYTGSSHIYDGIDVGLDTHHMYGTGMAGTNSEHLYCCSGVTRCSHLFYSYHMESCSFCLGCIGLKNKSYCILNKQYTKEERYTKVDEIFTQMEQDGQLGEFFPASMNPFYFNDTAAYLIDPSFTKEEVTAKGYLRRDEPIKVDIPEGAKVVKTQELDQYEGRKDTSSGTIVKDLSILSGDASTSAFTTGDLAAGHIRWIDPEILKVIIQDDQGNVYKIVKMEYDFLMKYGLPLPRKHRLDRMKENFRIQ